MKLINKKYFFQALFRNVKLKISYKKRKTLIKNTVTQLSLENITVANKYPV